MTRLGGWVAWAMAERPDPGQQQLPHRYAVWHVIRRLRGRPGTTNATHGQRLAAQQNIKAAIALPDWLTAHDPAAPPTTHTRSGHTPRKFP